MQQPLVSICSLVYNHESYLRQCLDGFVMQKTTFPFEVVIHDDASTDGSADIIREYAERYPDVFVPIYQTENQYSKGIKVSSTFVFPRARGKYIALCEGDDYWTDPLKLQKQVDFLEANPDYGLVFTNSQRWLEDKQKMTPSAANPYDGDAFERLLQRNFIATLTVCFRHEMLQKIQQDYLEQAFCMGDYPLWLEIARLSKIKYLPDVTAVYRVLPNSASHAKDRRKQYLFHRNACEVKRYFADKYDAEKIKNQIEREYAYWNALVLALEGKTRDSFRFYIDSHYFQYMNFARYVKCLLIH